MNKKNLFYWSLYDFANSFVFINFLLYFSQWLVIDGGLSDFWYNAIFVISSILLILTAPILASFTDKFGGRKYFLSFSTFGVLIGYALATLFAYLNFPMFIIVLCFFLGQYFYQLSFCFHNPLIEDVADERHRSRASGICQFANALGQLSGLILALAFSANRLSPLFPSIIVFFILSLPILFWFKESKQKEAELSLNFIKNESKNFVKKFIIFLSVSASIPLLVAFFFFNDALITLSNNYSIYMERVFMLDDSVKNYILMLILIMSAIGGLVFGKISDKIGTKKSLKIILMSWVILLPLFALLKSLTAFIVICIFLGLFMGGIWTVTRAYLSLSLEKENYAYGFSFYTLFERFATFLGPLTWGTYISVAGTDPIDYRTAVLLLTIYVITGLLIFHFWKREKSKVL